MNIYNIRKAVEDFYDTHELYKDDIRQNLFSNKCKENIDDIRYSKIILKDTPDETTVNNIKNIIAKTIGKTVNTNISSFNLSGDDKLKLVDISVNNPNILFDFYIIGNVITYNI